MCVGMEVWCTIHCKAPRWSDYAPRAEMGLNLRGGGVLKGGMIDEERFALD